MKKSKNKDDKSMLSLAYERKFRELYGEQKVDRNLRGEVLSTISQIENFARIAGLFTGLFAKTQIDLLSGDKGIESP